jgi:hypothetical protein
MSVTFDQVKQWIATNGISHAVGAMSLGYSFTICDIMISGDPDKDRTKRICKRCREKLKQCELVDSQSKGTDE